MRRAGTDGQFTHADDGLGTVAIGDTKNPGPRLVVSREAFGGLLAGIKAGEFDR